MKELVQALLKREILQNLRNRAIVHLELLQEVEKTKNLSIEILPLLAELKETNDRIYILTDQINLYVLAENILECNDILTKSMHICNKIRATLEQPKREVNLKGFSEN